MSAPVVFAFLPQHTWEVGAGLMAACVVVLGATMLIRTREMAFGVALLGLGIALGVASALVHAEAPCDQCHRGHWGGTIGVAILALWSLFVVASTAINVRRLW